MVPVMYNSMNNTLGPLIDGHATIHNCPVTAKITLNARPVLSYSATLANLRDIRSLIAHKIHLIIKKMKNINIQTDTEARATR